jgi:hypothetical protein
VRRLEIPRPTFRNHTAVVVVVVVEDSGYGCCGSPILLRRRSDGPLMNRTTGFTHPWSGFQERNLPGSKATVMDKLITDRATGPASTKHRLVPIEIFLADSAQAWLNWKRQRLPLAAAFSNTHRGRSIAGQPAEKQAKRVAGLLKLSYLSFRLRHRNHVDEFHQPPLF